MNTRGIQGMLVAFVLAVSARDAAAQSAPDASFYCFRSGPHAHDARDQCYPSEPECTTQRSFAERAHVAQSACTAAPVAYCITYDDPAHTGLARLCFGDARACADMYTSADYASRHVDGTYTHLRACEASVVDVQASDYSGTTRAVIPASQLPRFACRAGAAPGEPCVEGLDACARAATDGGAAHAACVEPASLWCYGAPTQRRCFAAEDACRAHAVAEHQPPSPGCVHRTQPAAAPSPRRR